VSEVEIIWPASLEQERLDAAADELAAAGVETTCRIQPVRRGAETAVLVLLTTSALEPFLKAVFQTVGQEAYGALKRFVGKLFGHDPTQKPDAATTGSPDVVIFESTTSGAQFLFTSGLPNEAFKLAVELDPGPEPGRWVWDSQAHNWLKFENLSPQGG
jgi:hypothetical protein